MIQENITRRLFILASAAFILVLGVALAGDLRSRPLLYLSGFVALSVIMVAAFRLVRSGGERAWKIALIAALLFRIAAVAGPPSMSDDLYRYVWDGRVQQSGRNPYAVRPEAKELEPLRDDHWKNINHREIGTIYPPAAQLAFRFLVMVGGGPRFFRLAFGALDFCLVLVLAGLLRKMRLPAARVVFYAWNPLAIFETAGSGHLEPLGTLLMVLSVYWLVGKGRSPIRAAAALAVSVQVKLLSAALLPGHLRRMKLPAVLVLGAVSAGLVLPFALSGPVVGEGLYQYAERWEENSFVYGSARSGFEALDTGNRLKPWVRSLSERFEGSSVSWKSLYFYVWPKDLAKGTVVLLASAWVLWLTFRRGLHPAVESLWVMGGLLLLLPTVHPWSFLWVLPFAAVLASPGWLLLGATLSLGYLGMGESLPWWGRALEYGLPLVWILPEAARSFRGPGRAPI